MHLGGIGMKSLLLLHAVLLWGIAIHSSQVLGDEQKGDFGTPRGRSRQTATRGRPNATAGVRTTEDDERPATRPLRLTSRQTVQREIEEIRRNTRTAESDRTTQRETISRLQREISQNIANPYNQRENSCNCTGFAASCNRSIDQGGCNPAAGRLCVTDANNCLAIYRTTSCFDSLTDDVRTRTESCWKVRKQMSIVEAQARVSDLDNRIRELENQLRDAQARLASADDSDCENCDRAQAQSGGDNMASVLRAAINRQPTFLDYAPSLLSGLGMFLNYSNQSQWRDGLLGLAATEQRNYANNYANYSQVAQRLDQTILPPNAYGGTFGALLAAMSGGGTGSPYLYNYMSNGLGSLSLGNLGLGSQQHGIIYGSSLVGVPMGLGGLGSLGGMGGLPGMGGLFGGMGGLGGLGSLGMGSPLLGGNALSLNPLLMGGGNSLLGNYNPMLMGLNNPLLMGGGNQGLGNLGIPSLSLNPMLLGGGNMYPATGGFPLGGLGGYNPMLNPQTGVFGINPLMLAASNPAFGGGSPLANPLLAAMLGNNALYPAMASNVGNPLLMGSLNGNGGGINPLLLANMAGNGGGINPLLLANMAGNGGGINPMLLANMAGNGGGINPLLLSNMTGNTGGINPQLLASLLGNGNNGMYPASAGTGISNFGNGMPYIFPNSGGLNNPGGLFSNSNFQGSFVGNPFSLNGIPGTGVGTFPGGNTMLPGFPGSSYPAVAGPMVAGSPFAQQFPGGPIISNGGLNSLSLLNNPNFLSTYPQSAQFLAQRINGNMSQFGTSNTAAAVAILTENIRNDMVRLAQLSQSSGATLSNANLGSLFSAYGNQNGSYPPPPQFVPGQAPTGQQTPSGLLQNSGTLPTSNGITNGGGGPGSTSY